MCIPVELLCQLFQNATVPKHCYWLAMGNFESVNQRAEQPLVLVTRHVLSSSTIPKHCSWLVFDSCHSAIQSADHTPVFFTWFRHRDYTNRSGSRFLQLGPKVNYSHRLKQAMSSWSVKILSSYHHDAHRIVITQAEVWVIILEWKKLRRPFLPILQNTWDRLVTRPQSLFCVFAT